MNFSTALTFMYGRHPLTARKKNLPTKGQSFRERNDKRKMNHRVRAENEILGFCKFPNQTAQKEGENYVQRIFRYREESVCV